MTVLRGITWNHRRAYQPLEAFEARFPAIPQVRWDRQPLAGFEAHPIAELARTYDLIILDHPGLGAALAAEALLPLGELFDEDQLAGWRSRMLPTAWDSYRLGGAQWALPIDAATQVSAFRPDLMACPPTTWPEVADLRATPFALCLGGPHALLHLLAMSAGSADHLLPHDSAVEALSLLQQLWRRCDQGTSLLDPIGIHDTLALTDDLAYCPLVYGYASYCRADAGAKALRWADAPAAAAGQPPGSVLGGTGLAVSARADRSSVRAWIRAYLAEDVQSNLVPANAGQPAELSFWEQADGPLAEYCRSTRSSILNAKTRPRADGWIPFQDTASEIVRTCIVAGTSARTATAEINRLYTKSVSPGEV